MIVGEYMNSLSKVHMVGTPTCTKCKSMKPELEKYCQEHNIPFEYSNITDISSELMELIRSKNILAAPVFFIYNEDSEVFLKTIPDNYIDMIMTSPPYDNLRTYDAEKNSWNFDKFKKIARELVRILKDGGVIAWNVNDKVINGSKSCTSYKQVL